MSSNIQVFHEYNRIARRGGVESLTHTCGEAYALRADTDGEPLLRCYYCNVRVHPGERMIAELTAKIDEYKRNAG